MIPRPHANGQRVKPVRMEELDFKAFKGLRSERGETLHRPTGSTFPTQFEKATGFGTDWDRIVNTDAHRNRIGRLTVFDLRERKERRFDLTYSYQRDLWESRRVLSDDLLEAFTTEHLATLLPKAEREMLWRERQWHINEANGCGECRCYDCPYF